jgi:hypothetical protein
MTPNDDKKCDNPICAKCISLEAHVEFLEALINVIARDLSQAQQIIKQRYTKEVHK